jgi:NTP pyrophosphatase (non-canonical NTP hydrolase)
MISPQNWSALLEYIDDIHRRTPELTRKTDFTPTEHTLSALSCLTEEVGELAAEVRKFTKCSFSQKKVDAFRIEDLEDEASDVLITLLLLLRSLKVDSLDASVVRKMEKNKVRGY